MPSDQTMPSDHTSTDQTSTDHTGPAEPIGAHHGYISDKKRYLARLKRIEGQARGIHRMVEEEQYCIDILTQISALTSALEGVALGLLDDHLKHCVADAARLGGPEGEAKIERSLRGHRQVGPILNTPPGGAIRTLIGLQPSHPPASKPARAGST